VREIFHRDATALQTQLQRVAHPPNALGEKIQFSELRTSHGVPAGTQRRLGSKAVEQSLDLLKGKSCLLRKSQHIDASDCSRVVEPAAACPCGRRQDAYLFVIA
jgi:hypothetical protein